MRRALAATLVVTGLILVARLSAGPLRFWVPVNSPLGLETVFSLAALLLLGIRGHRETAGQETARRTLDRADFLVALALTLITLAAFARSAGDYFLSDDFILLSHAANTNFKNLFTSPGGDGFFRPVGYVLYAVTLRFAGLNPAAWHWAGFALHAGNVVLVFVLAAELGLSRFGAAVAGLLFALHGSRAESVLWMAGRFDLYATCFALVAILCFLRSWHAAGLLAMAGGLLCKESAYAVPGLLVAVLAYQRRLWTRQALPILAYFAVALVLFAYRWRLLGGIGGYHDEAFSVTLPAFKALFVRLWTVLFFPINWGVTPSLGLAILAAAFVLSSTWLFTASLPRRLFLFLLSLTLLAALPALPQLLIGADIQKSRLLYLPSFGFALLIGASTSRLTPLLRWSSAIAVIAFQLGSLEYNLGAWRDAARSAQMACTVAAVCALRCDGVVSVSPPPSSLNGVYYFANGFPECVRLQVGAAWIQFVVDKSKACSFEWSADGSLIGHAKGNTCERSIDLSRSP